MAIAGFWNSLAEAQKIVHDQFVKGVIAEIIEDGGIVSRFPVTNISGTQLTYNREATLPSGSYHAIGDAWVSSTAVTYSQQTATLKEHGDQFELSERIKQTYDNPNTMSAVAMQQASKGLKRKMEIEVIYGSTSSDANAISGLHALCATAQTVDNGTGTTGAPLSVHNLDKAIDLIRGGKPDFLLMSRATRRRLAESGRGGSTNYPVMMVPGATGMRLAPEIEDWRGIPIVASDYMLMTEALSGGTYSAATGGVTGSILIMRFGNVEGGGLSMGMSGGLFQKKELLVMETKNASLMRIFTFFCLVLGATKSLARVDGILDLPVVA